MSDAPDGGEKKKTSRARVAWIALALSAAAIMTAIGLSIYQSPRAYFRAWSLYNRITQAMEGSPDADDRPRNQGASMAQILPRKPMEVVIREIEQGEEADRARAIGLTRVDLTPDELRQVFPHLIRAMKDRSEAIRNVAASVVGNLPGPFPGDLRVAEQALAALLDDPSPDLRLQAAVSLRAIARGSSFDAPPPRLVECLDDDDARIRIWAADALIEYGQGPELIVPVALRRIASENPGVPRAGDVFRAVFWQRLEPSVLPQLIEGLKSERTDIRLLCTAAINHMGRDARPALPAILKLIRTELDSPHPGDRGTNSNILGMAAGAVGQLTPDAPPPPGAVELLCEIVKRSGEAAKSLDPGPPGSPGHWAKDREREASIDELAHAVWSLGILNHAASPSVPLLLSTFESLPEDLTLRGTTAQVLAEIVRGTPDEDRVLAVLAKAWKTAPEQPKPAITRALRRFGPKAEEIVPDLTTMPADQQGSQIRPVRYPRSRHELPVRE
ncbi:MAG: HEAT repeat domain-containing protein [Isosphaeraceae bacterium]